MFTPFNFQETIANAWQSLDPVKVVDEVAEAFVGKADSLRDGSEFDPLTLPRDLYAHRNAQTEWWYYTGHLKTSGGRRFGFELCFFKRRTDLDRFGQIPLRVFGNPIYFAHFAITDIDGRQFEYSHRKSSNGLLEAPASASEKHYHLRLGDWSIRESGDSHVMRASISDDIVFEATVTPQKPVVLNGSKGDGVSFKDEGQASRYFSYTRMSLEGDLTFEGRTEHFDGSAWMDREFGTWTPTEKQQGWDWFSIQLENGTDLMVYQLRDSKNKVSDYSSGVLVGREGSYRNLNRKDFEVRATGYWKSPNSGAVYPSGWIVEVPGEGLELRVEPLLRDQELDTRGTTMIVYWEGTCKVSGTQDENDVKGQAYVELVGYDRSHDNPNLAYFLMGNILNS
ncbi:MAG: carotenoid 1,2-hydratase [Pyrinomonadaceae bacterium]|nr:carotenoid 1,2-hydratase [Pyrinomonadaceae bacterium]